MNDSRINLESLLLSYYIKYDRLVALCNMALSDIQSPLVDIYVDLYDMLKPLYTRDVYSNKRFIITSSIINLAAHLRGYFWSRHRLMTKIFLVYGESSTMQHKIFYPTFGDDEFKNTLGYGNNNKLITDQLELVKILCGYINDVYYVNKKSSFSMFVYDNITREVNNIPAIILSKSRYCYQLPALYSNAKIFRPKKSNREDISYVVSSSNIYRNYYNKITSNNTLDILSTISPYLLNVMITLTGIPSYNMNSIVNVTTASKMVIDAINNHRIIDGYNSDPDLIYKALIGIDKYVDSTLFKYRFNAIDLPTQHRIYNSTPEARDMLWYINLNDPETMKSINNKYFIDNPLDLNNL